MGNFQISQHIFRKMETLQGEDRLISSFQPKSCLSFSTYMYPEVTNYVRKRRKKDFEKIFILEKNIRVII